MTRVLRSITLLSTLWLIFVSLPAETEGGTLAGASFVFDAGRPIVFSVVRDSPSYLGGLSVGDILLSVNGRPSQELGYGLDLSIEMDLISGNSVLLEVLKDTGYKALVWIKIPRLTVAQRRFLSFYTDFRFVWDRLKVSWSKVVESYRFYLEGYMSQEVLSSHIRDFSDEIHLFRNSLISDGLPAMAGTEWDQLRKAQSYMISALYLMDQETQRMSSEGKWKVDLDGIRSRISSAEKCLTLSLNSAGKKDTEDRMW
ncbi:MAG: PDZ domain-containing protein [Dethiosulfovibrio sp.]|nr:PDZ domain-containing protein [Dethiosulfovibrio sp.]